VTQLIYEGGTQIGAPLFLYAEIFVR
jgi:hypothetical protein